MTDDAVRPLLLRQAGVISRAQALRAGVTPRQIDRLLRDGTWIRRRPGVYQHGCVVPGPETGLRAASLWLGPGAVLTGLGAAWWWGLVPDPPPGWTFALAGTSQPRRGAGLTVRRVYVDPRHRTVRADVPVVTRPLAVLQAAVELENRNPGLGIALLDRAKQRHWTSGRTLVRLVADHAGTAGSTTARLLLRRTGSDAQSELERLAVRALREAGITGFVVNHRTTLPDGTTVELDIAFLERRVALELEGFAYHSDPAALRRDLRRANAVLTAWRLGRYTWDCVLSGRFVAEVRSMLAD